MPGYKHPCQYCDQLIGKDSATCPFCGKVNPLGPFRCPKCRNPVQKGYRRCDSCGMTMEVACPRCGTMTWFGDYCSRCDARLSVVCPNPKCGAEQPPLGNACVKCGRPLK